MRSLGLLLLIASGVLGYLSAVDRQSEPALAVVELEGQLPLPLYAMAGALGVLLTAASFLTGGSGAGGGSGSGGRSGGGRASPRPAEGRGTQPARSPLGAAPINPRGWRENVVKLAHSLSFEAGIFLTIDAEVGVPFLLTIQGATPEKAKRAVTTLGTFIASQPAPPRLAIVFKDCPEGSAPRHLLVTGALGSSIDRTTFKAVPRGERVDVMFSKPDPIWQQQW